jgi:hypothetical protein
VPDPPPAGLAVAGGEVAAETLASTGDDGGRERRFWTEGKEAWSLGSSGECFPSPELPGIGRRGWWRRRGRGVRGGERSEVARQRDEAFGGVGWALSLLGSFFSFFFSWMDEWMDVGWRARWIDGWICATSSIRGTNVSTNRNQADAIVFSLVFSSNFFYPLGPTKEGKY